MWLNDLISLIQLSLLFIYEEFYYTFSLLLVRETNVGLKFEGGFYSWLLSWVYPIKQVGFGGI